MSLAGRRLRAGTATILVFSLFAPAAPALVAASIPLPNPPANFADPWQACNGAIRAALPCADVIGAHGTWIANAVQRLYLRAIDHARAAEGLGPLSLPVNFAQLPATEQQYVLFNAERSSRGLPPFVGSNPQLAADARQASAANGDPNLNELSTTWAVGKDVRLGGVWFGGSDPLVADFMFMYDDGWGGSQTATLNVACTSATAAGCWGHRDAILGE